MPADMSMHRLCCCDGGTELTTFYVRCQALRFPHAYFEIGNLQDEAGDPKLDLWVLVEEGVLIPEDQGNPEHLYIYDLPFISSPGQTWFVTHPSGPKPIDFIQAESVGSFSQADAFAFRNLFLATDDIEPDLDSVIARGRNFTVLRRQPDPFDPNDPQQVCFARAGHLVISSLAIDPGLEDCNCQRESFSRTAAAPGSNIPDPISFGAFGPTSFLPVHSPYSGVIQENFTAKFNYQGQIQTVTLDLSPQNQSVDGKITYTGEFTFLGIPTEQTLVLEPTTLGTDQTFPRPGLFPPDSRYVQDQTRYNPAVDVGCNPDDDSFTTDHFCGGFDVVFGNLFPGGPLSPPLVDCSGGSATTLRWFGDRLEKFDCCP